MILVCHLTRTHFHCLFNRFINFEDHLSTIDGVALYKDRIIIPKQLRQTVLTALHAAHHGVTSMTAELIPPSFGRASLRISSNNVMIAITVVAWPHHNHLRHQHRLPTRNIRSNTSVATSSTIKATTTSFVLIGTQTGLSSKNRKKVPRIHCIIQRNVSEKLGNPTSPSNVCSPTTLVRMENLTPKHFSEQCCSTETPPIRTPNSHLPCVSLVVHTDLAERPTRPGKCAPPTSHEDC